MKTMTRMTLAVGLLFLGGTSVEAAVTEADDAVSSEINVTNNHWSAVKVYAEDARGRLHYLGFVERDRFEIFTVPTSVLEQGDFRIKVYPHDLDVFSPRPGNGIKTRAFSPGGDESVILLLSRDLASSVVLLDRG